MAHLWTLRASGDWAATPVDDAFALLDVALNRAENGLAETEAQERILLQRLKNPPDTSALLCDPQAHVRVNGEPVLLGLRILADRDEIRVSGKLPLFFSTETLARIEPFPNAAATGFCPRCKQAIETGSPAVRCPGCGLWHHASDDLPCWTYAPQCTACPQDTALDAGFRWTPEDL